MLELYPEQLFAQLNKGLCGAYLLLGNDPLLLQESQNAICQMAAMQGFNEHHTVQIDKNTDWQRIFSLCQAMNLFTSRQTLILMLPENGLNAEMNKQLTTLVESLHSDLLLMVRGNKQMKEQKNTAWFTRLATQQAVLVKCQTPNPAKLPKWVASRARQYNLQLNASACQLLCYCYEGNLLALVQVLEQLSLLCPDGKITLYRVEQAVNNSAHFTPFQWVDALLIAKSERVLHILRQLRLNGSDPAILLWILQHELLLLIALKRQSAKAPLRTLFDKHRVFKNRWAITAEAVNRFSHNQLRQAVHLLTQIELTLKQDYTKSIWADLESLSLFLCHKPLADIFIYS